MFICMQYKRVTFCELCVVVNGEILHSIVGVLLYAVQ